MQQAAGAVGATHGAWKKWEYAEREMPAGLWELYLLKISQHPDFIMAPRAGATGSAASLASRPSVDRS